MNSNTNNKTKITRRRFMQNTIAAGLSTCLADHITGNVIAAPGIAATASNARIIFQSSFEPGEPLLKAPQHKRVNDKACTGKYSMMGQVHGPKQACFLEIPFESKKGKVINVSYRVRTDKRSACATYVKTAKLREPVGRRIDNVPANKWLHVKTHLNIETDTKGVIQIVAPSSHDAPVGRAWIDDVSIVEVDNECTWSQHPEDFSALARDNSGVVWMAAIERPQNKGIITVSRLNNTGKKTVCRFDPTGSTAVFSPAIAAVKDGCVVAFAVEQNDQWRIAYSFINSKSSSPLRYIDCQGSSNISPALAVTHSKITIAWESNAGPHRGIYSATLTKDGHSKAQRISTQNANSYNPSIVALPDGRLFTAWDSVRNNSADIFGAWYKNGKWQTEHRITSGKRIERHPHLAVRNNELWMAWQGQSYTAMSINALREQLIAVARIDDGKLSAPKDLYKEVSRRNRLLMRPRIAFDSTGRLWLSARQSVAPQDGWQAMLWSYDSTGWSQPQTLMPQPGRWRPVDILTTTSGVISTSQYDDIPGSWAQRGIFRDWRSTIKIRKTELRQDTKMQRLSVEPLQFPETNFSLTEKMSLCSADLPRQKWKHNDDNMTLYWGDFHDHTDISVCGRRVNPPGHDLFANERDIEQIDFCALTDHGYNYDPPQWAFNGAQTRNNHDPGRFVTFLGQEWTSSKNPPAKGSRIRRYGHRNLIFLDPYHDTFYDSDDADISPAQVWKLLEGKDFICIPHQLADWKGKGGGNPPTDWSYTDEKLQPVAEIWQGRQSYEYHGCPRQAPQGAPFKGYYLQDAWAKGIVIGVIASPDHGGGKGKVGVWAKNLTREEIFEAIRARHTFGTSGAKMAIKFSAGNAIMGDKVNRTTSPIKFQIEALALRKITELVIFRNNEIVFKNNPNSESCKTTWTDGKPLKEKAWYYARIQAADEELAWSSPIWFI